MQRVWQVDKVGEAFWAEEKAATWKNPGVEKPWVVRGELYGAWWAGYGECGGRWLGIKVGKAWLCAMPTSLGFSLELCMTNRGF